MRHRPSYYQRERERKRRSSSVKLGKQGKKKRRRMEVVPGRRKGAAPKGSSSVSTPALITRLSRLLTLAMPSMFNRQTKRSTSNRKRLRDDDDDGRHSLLCDPRRMRSNSAPNRWSSLNWQKGVASSKGFHTAMSPASSALPFVRRPFGKTKRTPPANQVASSGIGKRTHQRFPN